MGGSPIVRRPGLKSYDLRYTIWTPDAATCGGVPRVRRPSRNSDIIRMYDLGSEKLNHFESGCPKVRCSAATARNGRSEGHSAESIDSPDSAPRGAAWAGRCAVVRPRPETGARRGTALNQLIHLIPGWLVRNTPPGRGARDHGVVGRSTPTPEAPPPRPWRCFSP